MTLDSAPHTTCTFSFHAAERMMQMGVTAEEVVDALADPETTYRSSLRHDDPERRIATRGRLAVVYSDVTHHVITVLWNRADSREDGPHADPQRCQQRRQSPQGTASPSEPF